MEIPHEFGNALLCFLHWVLAIVPYGDCTYFPGNRGVEYGHPLHRFVPTSNAVFVCNLNIKVLDFAAQRSNPAVRHWYGAADGFIQGLQFASFAVIAANVIVMYSEYTRLVEGLYAVVFESLGDLQKVLMVSSGEMATYLSNQFRWEALKRYLWVTINNISHDRQSSRTGRADKFCL